MERLQWFKTLMYESEGACEVFGNEKYELKNYW